MNSVFSNHQFSFLPPKKLTLHHQQKSFFLIKKMAAFSLFTQKIPAKIFHVSWIWHKKCYF